MLPSALSKVDILERQAGVVRASGWMSPNFLVCSLTTCNAQCCAW